MVQVILDVILYIPRKIYRHFKRFNELQNENAELVIKITNRDRLLDRISFECERTSYNNEKSRVRKIKELAQTFPNDYN